MFSAASAAPTKCNKAGNPETDMGSRPWIEAGIPALVLAPMEGVTDAPMRATGSHIGHGFEPQFAMNVALAALASSRGRMFADPARAGRQPQEASIDRVLVTGTGHRRGEGLALVERVHDA